MPNYYEILKIEPTATEKDIETAIEQQYNQLRRLVTHHDPNIVNQTNQALALLEQMRTTLLDPSKRDVYDAAVGVNSQQVGGLADPGLVFQNLQAIVIPPVAKTEPKLQATASFVDAWVCPKCSLPNSKGSPFCVECGTQVGIDCPGCHKKVFIQFVHCPNCGVNIKEYGEKQEREQQNRLMALQQINREIASLENQVVQLQERKPESLGGFLKLLTSLLSIAFIVTVILSMFEFFDHVALSILLFILLTVFRKVPFLTILLAGGALLAGIEASRYASFSRNAGDWNEFLVFYDYLIISIMALVYFFRSVKYQQPVDRINREVTVLLTNIEALKEKKSKLKL